VSAGAHSEQEPGHLLTSSPEVAGEVPSLPSPSADVPKTPKKRRLIATPEISSDAEVKEEELDQSVAGSSNGLAQEPSYSQSPAAAKRRKLTELAEARAQKRQRL